MLQPRTLDSAHSTNFNAATLYVVDVYAYLLAADFALTRSVNGENAPFQPPAAP